MYICKNCNKECTSQKKYLKHIEQCEEKDELIIRSKRSISSNASEFEDDDLYSQRRQRSKITLKDTVSKLLNDRNKHKSEIKKYKNEIRQQTKIHREELENNETYFQDQINNLLDEKDDLEERVKSTQDEIINEKNRLRTQFNNKLKLEKKRINDNNKNSLMAISQLQSNIDELKECLNTQIDEKEVIHQEYKNQIRLLTEQNRIVNERNQKEINTVHKNIEKERTEFYKLTQIYQEQKNNHNLTKQHINNLESKISTYVKNISKIELENKNYKNGIKSRNDTINDIESLNEALGTQIKQYNTIIHNLKLEINNLKQENINNTENHKQKYSIDKIKEQYENNIEILKHKHINDIESLKQKHQSNISNIREDYQNNITILNKKQQNNDTDKKLRMIEEKYILLQNQLKIANNKIEKLKKENENIKRQDNPNKREKEIQNNLRVTRDKCIENLRNQTIELKKIKEENLIIKKALENKKKIKQSYINNLNSQRDEYEETINKLKQKIEKKSTHIEELENKIINK